jgi:branched-chain amino acid transport system substrate-binding protein
MIDHDDVAPRTTRRGRPVVLALLVCVLLLAACGDDDDDENTGGSGSDTTTSVAGSVTTAAPTSAVESSPLGVANPAAGEPVKVGFVADGKTAALDNSDSFDVADAMTKYFNEYRGGIAGRPIELHTCDSGADPSKATDCATEMIQKGVLVTVMPSAAALTSTWRPLHEAGIPTFILSTTDKEVLSDTENTFALTSPSASLIELPIAVAKENNAKKVVGVIIDVPAATAIYEESGDELFGAVGLDFELVRVPLGQPDLTPQMSNVAKQADIAVHIVGNDTLDIAALQGLEASGFDGPISCLGCDADSVRTALGSKLEGITVVAQAASASGGVDGDTSDADLYHAIVEEYASGLDTPDKQVSVYTFQSFTALRDALEGLEGEVTSETIIQSLRSMPSMDFPMFGKGQFRCNGKAAPLYPAACANVAVLSKLDDTGHAGELTVTNTDPIPD